MVKLKTPKTIRLATIDEVPHDEAIIKRVEAAEHSNIVQGYHVVEHPNTAYPYKFFAEINVDIDQLWPLFKKMVLSMPDGVSLITGHKDDEANEVHNGEYQDKYGLINKLETYEKELVEDGFLKYGVIHQTAECVEEVFVHSAKYIQIGEVA